MQLPIISCSRLAKVDGRRQVIHSGPLMGGMAMLSRDRAEIAYHIHNMMSRALWRALAAGALLPLVAFSAILAQRSIERLYIAHLFAQGRTPGDDLAQAHVDVLLEL